jgi:hypothetical protein
VKDLTPSEILDRVREVVDRAHVNDAKDGVIELCEDGRGNKCPPIRVSSRGKFWALRVRHTDQIQLLAGSREDPEKSFRKVPDYILFAEPRTRKRKGGDGSDVWVLVCELKSSDAGVAGGAKRQVQLGKFLAEYLVRLGMFAAGRVKVRSRDESPRVDICGLIVSPSYPSQLRARSATRADENAASDEPDGPSDMLIYKSSSNEDLCIEDFFC